MSRARRVAEKALPFDQPYGGDDWYQSEGYSIYEEMVRSTACAVADAMYVIGPAHDSTPPGRYISGEGYAHYQVQVNGRRYTVQEHQLVALLDGADPEKVFSNGEYHIHHNHEIDNPSEWPWAAALLKQFNYPENLEVVENGDHAELTNGKRG